jgi:hypothetical protein
LRSILDETEENDRRREPQAAMAMDDKDCERRKMPSVSKRNAILPRQRRTKPRQNRRNDWSGKKHPLESEKT